MQLDYKIFWLEDNKEFVELAFERLEEHILNKGFFPNIEHKRNLDELDYQQDFTEYNLFLIDYQLSTKQNNNDSLFTDKSENGDYFIEFIQASGIFSHIIFYSSEAEMLKKQFINKMQNEDKNICEKAEQIFRGIHFLSKDRLFDDSSELYKILDFESKKASRINLMRGIILSEIANFDKEIFKILEHQKKYNNKIELELCKKIFEKKEEDFLKIINEPSDKIWEKVFDNKIIFDSMSRTTFFRSRILKEYEQLAHEIEKDYEELIKKRNKFAHDLELPFSEQDCINIRKEIINARNLFKKINEKLKIN